MVGNNANISAINNGLRHLDQKQHHSIEQNSQINLPIDKHSTASNSTTFFRRLLPFGGHKHNQTNNNCAKNKLNSKSDEKCESGGAGKPHNVKVLKQFWSNQITTENSSDNNLSKKQKSSTLKNFNFSHSNDNLLDLNRKEKTKKSLTLDNRTAITKSVESIYLKCDESSSPVEKNRKNSESSSASSRRNSLNIIDEFNKFKNADFIRNKKRLLEVVKDPQRESEHKVEVSKENSKNKKLRPDSLPGTFEGNISFPKVAKASEGGKIHWVKREDIFPKRQKTENSVRQEKSEISHSIGSKVERILGPKTNTKPGSPVKSGNSPKSESPKLFSSSKKMSVTTNPPESQEDSSKKDAEKEKQEKEKDKEDLTDSKMTASTISTTSSATTNTTTSNSTPSRKFSFRTTPATTTNSLTKKLTAGKGSKVAQLAQRFNEMIQHDATILEEVKKKGIVVHRSGGHIFKIREDKSEYKNSLKRNKQLEDFSDDSSLISSGKNSTRRKNAIKKRPSIRILIESPSKKGGNVNSKTQQYETNIIKKDTILLKPKIPDKSERVLAKTKELKNKKLSKKSQKTEYIVESYEVNENMEGEKIEGEDSGIPPNSTDETYASPKKLKEQAKLQEIAENKVEESVEEEIYEKTKSKYQRIYEMLRPSFLYGKKSPSPIKTEIESVIKEEPSEPEKLVLEEICLEENLEESESKVELAKEPQKKEISEEPEEVPDVEPIDFTLNIFNTDQTKPEMEQSTVEDNTNAMSQGQELKSSTSSNSITSSSQQQVDGVKPNQSFLYCDKYANATNTKTQFSSSCDIYLVDEGGEVETFNSAILGKLVANTDVDVNVDKPDFEKLDSGNEDNLVQSDSSTADKDNTYEIIKKPNAPVENSKDSSLENIYQSVAEVKKGDKDSDSIKSYESFENYDILTEKSSTVSNSKKEDDYELCDPEPPEPPPPRKPSEGLIISPPILTSTTSNLIIPDLPVPKRNVSPNIQANETYEKIKYDQIPNRHPKPVQLIEKQLPLPPRNKSSSSIAGKENENEYDDENIYDTIKNADNRSLISGYESINTANSNSNSSNITGNNTINKSPSSNRSNGPSSNLTDNPYRNSTNDTMSIISNCYESISLKQNYSTINQILRHAISTTTLSSEHRTNSIYGTTVGQSLTPPSDRSGSDNSDEWIDLSDDELEDDLHKNDKHNFIV